MEEGLGAAGGCMKRRKDSNRIVYQSLAMVMQFGLNMVVPICMMSALGIWLDRKLGTSWLTIIFFMVGAIAGGQNIYHMVKRICETEDEQEDQRRTDKEARNRQEAQNCTDNEARNRQEAQNCTDNEAQNRQEAQNCTDNEAWNQQEVQRRMGRSSQEHCGRD